MFSIERTDPPLAGDEAATLLGFLDYQRDTLRMKLEGLTPEQLDTAHPPSDMTLGGMMKHLALVEHWWFYCVFGGHEFGGVWADVDWEADADWDWHSAADDTPEQIRTLFEAECAASDAIVAAVADWGELSVRRGREADDRFSLRWIVAHMVEEYARHNGHADLIRESIDGVTGE